MMCKMTFIKFTLDSRHCSTVLSILNCFPDQFGKPADVETTPAAVHMHSHITTPQSVSHLRRRSWKRCSQLYATIISVVISEV